MALTNCKECKTEISTKATQCPKCGAKIKKTSLFTKIVAGFFALFMVFVVINSGKPKPPPAPPSNSALALEKTELDLLNWHIGGFGTTMLADIKIVNNSDYKIEDIEVVCFLSGKSGTSLSTPKKVIYDVVAPKSSKTFRKVNLGSIHPDSAKASCDVLILNAST